MIKLQELLSLQKYSIHVGMKLIRKKINYQLLNKILQEFIFNQSKCLHKIRSNKSRMYRFEDALIDLDILALGFVSFVSFLGPSATVVPRRPDPLEPASDMLNLNKSSTI